MLTISSDAAEALTTIQAAIMIARIGLSPRDWLDFQAAIIRTNMDAALSEPRMQAAIRLAELNFSPCRLITFRGCHGTIYPKAVISA
jgi:hypothetical protein